MMHAPTRPRFHIALCAALALAPLAAAADQAARRLARPNFVGTYYDGDVLITPVGRQLNEKVGVVLIHQTHRGFVRLAGRASGLPIGDGPFLNPTSVYGQGGIDYAEIRTPHLFVANARYYVHGPFYLAGGLVYQQGYYRAVKFKPRDRTVGDSIYQQLDLKVKTKLKPRVAPLVGFGMHYVFERYPVGLYLVMVNGVGGPARSNLDRIEITADQTIAPQDLAQFRRKIKDDAEEENYGNFLFGITYAF